MNVCHHILEELKVSNKIISPMISNLLCLTAHSENKQPGILAPKQSWKQHFRLFKKMTTTEDILAFLKASQEARVKEKEEDKEIRAEERKEDMKVI